MDHAQLSRTLLERDAELSAIGELVKGSIAGGGRLLVVEGQAGAGKTRLLEYTRELAERRGMRALAARGGELERDLSLGVVRQLFEPLLRGADAARREELLAGSARLAAPALGIEAMAAAPPSPGAVEHGLYWLAVNAVEHAPLALCVDDAHWADGASLAWLAFLLRRAGDLPLLVAVAARDSEPAPRSEALDPLLADPIARVLRPRPLGEDGAAELIRAELGSSAAAEFCRACHRATGGNPLLLSQLLAALAAERVEPAAEAVARVEEIGPRSVSASVFLRLERMSGGAPALAQAVAVLERGAELRLAAALADLDAEEAAACVDALARAQILTADRPLSFVHPIVRAAVYEDMPPAARALAHARAARLLHVDGAPPELVARHVLKSEPAADPWAVELLRDAAHLELARGAPDSAAAFLRRALREPPTAVVRPTLLGELGRAALRSGDASAVEHLEAAVALMPDPRARAETALELARALFTAGQMRTATDVLAGARDGLGTADYELAVRLDAELIGAARLDLETRPLALERLADRAEFGADPSPAERLILAHMAVEAASELRPAEEAAELAERALAGGALALEEGGESPVLHYAVHALVLADRLDEGIGVLDIALDDARARGSALAFLRVLSVRSDMNLRRGRVSDCLADARAGLAVEGVDDLGSDLRVLLGDLVHGLVERGELDEAAAELRSYGLDGPGAGTYFDAFLAHARGRLWVAQGRYQEAADELLGWLERQEAWGALNPGMIPWRSTVAPALAAVGRADEARALMAVELERARAVGSARAIGIALTAAGGVAERADSMPLLAEAVDVLAGSPASLDHARAQVQLGSALRRAGRRADARELLTLGLDSAHRCGALALVAHAREELLAAGSRPRRIALSGRDSLTPSELRVAQLASDGMTNRELAQALFVTVKTIEMHLGHAYRKLGISSRAELSAALEERS